MPRRTTVPQGSLLDDRSRVIFHRQWQALRRHAGYRRAVQTCLQDMDAFAAGVIAQLDALEQASTTPEGVDHAARLGTARTLAAQCMASQGWLHELVALERTLHSGVFPVDWTTAIPAKQRDLYNATYHQLTSLCQPQTEIMQALLVPFVDQWRIRLPLDPAIPVLPSFVALHVWETACAIEVFSPPANDEMVLTLHVRPGASNVRDGPVLALVRSDMNGYSMCQGLTSDTQLNLERTYETLY